ncbi:hypothetical protein MBLNU457_3431t1 [Dothideomycetes sp. NU457]
MPPALEISIPQTSTATTSGKAYTLYHIVLTLPIRTHEIKKRYSDFTDLHKALESQTGSAPPSQLPAKTWLRKTTTDAALTESRRKELEAYLRAILTNTDGRWRQSPAWRAFLNLPKGITTSSSDTADRSTALDPSEWLDVHRDAKTQIHNARLALKRRDQARTATEQHSLSAEAKAALVRAATAIARCDDALKSSRGADSEGWGGSGRLGEGEARRRKDLLAASRKEVESLETMLRSMPKSGSGSNTPTTSSGVGGAAASESDKEALWRGTGAGQARPGRVLGGPMKETERTREQDNQGVLMLQKQVMQEQDQDVLEIGKSVARMKEMGIMINEELVVQNQMLGLLEEDVDRVQGKIDVGKKRIGKIR